MKWLILLIPCILLSGCVDRSGYEECKESYDNLILEDGFKIISHSSDFVTSAEGRYFVTYKIHNMNLDNPETYYVYGFVYDSVNDELIYSPDGLTPELPIQVIDWN